MLKFLNEMLHSAETFTLTIIGHDGKVLRGSVGLHDADALGLVVEGEGDESNVRQLIPWAAVRAVNVEAC